MTSSQSISCKRIILPVAETLEELSLCMNWLDCSHLLRSLLSSPLLTSISILFTLLLSPLLLFTSLFHPSPPISSPSNTFPLISSFSSLLSFSSLYSIPKNVFFSHFFRFINRYLDSHLYVCPSIHSSGQS